MKTHNQLKLHVLPQTPLLAAAVSRFCHPSTNPKDRHDAIRILTTLVVNAVNYPTRTEQIERPDGVESLTQLDTSRMVGIPVLRAGVAMAPAFKAAIPTARVNLLGAKRSYASDGATLASTYYDELDSSMEGQSAYFLDTVLASGVSFGAAIDIARMRGCTDISVLTGLAAPEGVKYLNDLYPEAKIYAASMAEGLNEHAYIFNPTPGDAGDRLFGASECWQNVVETYVQDSQLEHYRRESDISPDVG